MNKTLSLVHPARALGKKIVVIVGAGFAGLNAAKILADQDEVHVVLIDQSNHHLFQPLLYQVATAGLNPSDIAVPIRAQFSNNKNIEVHLAKVTRVQLQQGFVAGTTDLDLNTEYQLTYDYLILACGSRHSYFANPKWEEFAPGLKSLEQATEIRRRILSVFEQAENQLDEAGRAALLNFIIVGGGPTGVELAGAIADIGRTVLIKDFKRINPADAKVILIEAGARILSSFSEELSAKALLDLKELGVEVRTKTEVKEITATRVSFANSEYIETKCALWCAGVHAVPLLIEPQPETDRASRIRVTSELTIPNFQEVFAVGDLASISINANQVVPGLAPAAIQAGKHAALSILARIRGQEIKSFKFQDRGQMATIGKNKALVQAGKLRLTGRPAWFAWMFVHIFYLVGFKNRALVIFEWSWSYMFSKRGSRLITSVDWRLDK